MTRIAPVRSSPKQPTEEGEYCDDHTKPRKVHYKPVWNPCQDAVYWIHLGRAQEKGTAFWQSKSHAIFAFSTFPPDCIERDLTTRRMTIYQRSSTPRPAPRTVLKSTWHEQQQAAEYRQRRNSFQVDVRVPGVSQDVMGQGRITKIQTLVDRLRDGSRSKAIQKDLKQEGSNVFSEASKRAIKDMGNIELYELGETVRTTQCPTCFRHSEKEQSTACAVSV